MIAPVSLHGKIYRCEVLDRRTPDSTFSDPMYENSLYHGRANIHTGSECANYEVDRANINEPFVANVATKHGTVNGSFPLEAPISIRALRIHNNLE